MSQLAIVEAFTALPDTRRSAGQRHTQALCLALFTLSVTAGNRGFLAIGDWLWAYHDELVAMFAPRPKGAYHLTAQFGGHCCDSITGITRLVYLDSSAFNLYREKPLPPTARCCEALMKPSAMTPQ